MIPGRARSTKAGERSPATAAWSPKNREPDMTAQRRPGRDPRRQCRRRKSSASAGSAPLNEGRGEIPGDRLDWAEDRRKGDDCAQRRPGRDPRRQDVQRRLGRQWRARSTKAGERSPATGLILCLYLILDISLNEGRGEIPGDRLYREPSSATRRYRRSTKAGERSPATAGFRRESPRGRGPPLNEGRGEIPGDRANRASDSAIGALGSTRAASERRGRPHSVRIGLLLSHRPA